MNKPNLLQQIEFIAGARKVVSEQDGIVELDSENAEMLKAIEENLIALRNAEHAAEKKQTNIEFDNSEEPSEEITGDYNAHEFAERQHRIQRDLK